ncbi:hypothetical protein PIB30_094228 [Stylosanthes scabra]|uniref:Uncharacterized protein n=1 Tax=Stylosanthes scabra TaxID=79078 RepID=A0ABU6RW64_9FABA|nr:hypothetical protein [Stylosanthes scabra]
MDRGRFDAPKKNDENPRSLVPSLHCPKSEAHSHLPPAGAGPGPAPLRRHRSATASLFPRSVAPTVIPAGSYLCLRVSQLCVVPTLTPPCGSVIPVSLSPPCLYLPRFRSSSAFVCAFAVAFLWFSSSFLFYNSIFSTVPLTIFF